jgi:NitT/TauT family transport system substrate-binding protein
MSRVAAAAFGLALSTLLALPAGAADTLKLAIGQRGIWHGATADLGQRAGIFKKYDLALEILYTAGAGDDAGGDRRIG